MSDSNNQRGRKGTFGKARLPVATRYPRLASTSKLLWLGALLAVALLAWAATDFFLGQAKFVSSGPLSSNHAVLENDCAACHQDSRVTNQACSSCHEKTGDELGIYTFSAHYLYRSNDFQRLESRDGESPCAACHPEHRGRDANITQVADSRCLDCHQFGSFGDQHPQFDVIADNIPDGAGLSFGHIRHVREISERQGWIDVERSCLACHQPLADGKNFAPIDFDRSCDACHLDTAVRTPRLPIGRAEDQPPGVETLAMIRQRHDPASRWADYTSAAEFQEVGSRVIKKVIHHRDPWILTNLRHLRDQLWQSSELADLLTTTADVAPHQLGELYQEAIDNLELLALVLRGRPEPLIQQELSQIDAQLRSLRQALRDPFTPLDESQFLFAESRARRDEVSAERAAEIEELIGQISQPCQQCHQLRDGTLVRVQKNQQTLRRAEFNHGAHILELRCLDCHSQIPIAAALADSEVDTSGDLASVHNLPPIETCQQCHNPRLASDSCITCHSFHPDKSHHADLLLYLD